MTVPRPDHLYDREFLGEPFITEADLEIEGAKFAIRQQINLQVVPAVEIQSISPSPCVRTEETLAHCNKLSVILVNHRKEPFAGMLTTSIPNRAATMDQRSNWLPLSQAANGSE